MRRSRRKRRGRLRKVIRLVFLGLLGILVGIIGYEAIMLVRVVRLRSHNPATTSLIETRMRTRVGSSSRVANKLGTARTDLTEFATSNPGRRRHNFSRTKASIRSPSKSMGPGEA